MDDELPFEYDGDGPTYDPDDEDYAAMPDMLTCDGDDGCMVMFEATSDFDHCTTEGTCWTHCANIEAHTFAQGQDVGLIKETFMPLDPPEAETPFATPFVETVSSKWMLLPKKDEGAEQGESMLTAPASVIDSLTKTGTGESVQQATASVTELLVNGSQQDVHEEVKEILAKASAPGYMPTQAERIALFVAGLEAIAYVEHGTNVAYTEGRTLAKHKADFGNQCGVCENLDNYMTQALEMLRPLAEQQVAEAQQVAQQQVYIAKGVCVDCGEPPVGGRIYSLEEGQGFMCANCAGPFLLMDDGKPGNAWPEDAQAVAS